MALNTNPFVEGIDPTSTFGGYASVLLQLIRQAQPSSTYGMILFDTTTPDVTGANAWRKRCIWLNLTDPAIPTVNVYRESAPGWVNVQSVIPANTITTAMINNAAVTIAKLSTAGGVANQLIRVNATATAFEFVSLANLVTVGSILPSAISGVAVPAGSTRFLGNYNAGTTNWFGAQQIIEEVPVGVIDATQIAPSTTSAARSRFITTRTADINANWRYFEPNVDLLTGALNGDKLTDNTVPVSKIIAGPTEGSLLAVVGGTPDWVPAPAVTTKYVSTVPVSSNIPINSTPVTFIHSLGGIPTTYRMELECLTTDAGWNPGDRICSSSLIHDNGGNFEFPAFTTQLTSTSIVVWRQLFGGAAIALYATNKSTANFTALNVSKWAILVYATRTV